jgi:hypothetical protein
MLAREGGYNKEFFEAYNKPKQYDIEYCNLKTIGFLRKDNDGRVVQDLREYDRLICDYSEYTKYAVVEQIKYACKECCYKKTSRLKVTADETAYIGTEIFRFENVDYVTHSIQDDVKTVEYTDCKSVDLDVHVYKDCEDELDIIAKNVNYLSVGYSGRGCDRKINFNCENVDCLVLIAVPYSCLDLTTLEGVKKVCLGTYKSFSEVMDFSCVDEVKISGSTNQYFMSNVKEVKFKDGAKVQVNIGKGVEYAQLPVGFDLSNCSEVDLCCQLGKFETMRFREGAKVKFSSVKEFPKVLDVSMCDEVAINFFEFEHLNEVILKDMAQLEDILAKNLVPEAQEKMRNILKRKVTFVNGEKPVIEEDQPINEEQPVKKKMKIGSKWEQWFGRENE